MDEFDDLRTRLLAQQAEWEDRLRRIRADRRRESDPLEGDWHDRAIQQENDETLDALDAAGRRELDEIREALERLATGRFGWCLRCSQAIARARLDVLPSTPHCAACAAGTGAD